MKRTDPNQLPLDWDAASRENNLAGQKFPSAAPPARPPVARRRHADVVARLPVPRPLPAHVAAGHFGHDDDGKAIRPQPDEIRAITENLAERLVELLDAMSQVTSDDARRAMQDQFTQGIQMYAMEFGERPARQLEAYVRRQASLEDAGRSDQGRSR